MKSIKEALRTLVHPGPIATLVLIKTITLSVIYTSLMLNPPHSSVWGLLSLSTFLSASGLTLYNFFAAIFFGPGYLPKGWKPGTDDACKKLQFCSSCSGYKAPRSHHCRQCGRCVMKMDHHCPWINGCVGHSNQANFVTFLVSAVIGCSEATVILSLSLYHAVYRTYYLYYEIEAPIVYLSIYGFIWCLFSLGCAFGVAFGCSMLLYYQIKIIWRNCTSIEEWIIEKAHYRRSRNPELPSFVYPYDLGWKRNVSQVLNWSCEPVGDGIIWPLAKNCDDQYILTVEQLEQKNEKRVRTKEYSIVENFSGSWCPLSKGFGPLFHPPCSDEPRIRLNKDDKILVSRWKKYWLYGEKLSFRSNQKLIKGWFPRRCGVEVINPLPERREPKRMEGPDGDFLDDPHSQFVPNNSNHNLSNKKKK